MALQRAYFSSRNIPMPRESFPLLPDAFGNYVSKVSRISSLRAVLNRQERDSEGFAMLQQPVVVWGGHTPRRTYLRYLCARGCQLPAISCISRHSSQAVLAHLEHETPSDVSTDTAAACVAFRIPARPLPLLPHHHSTICRSTVRLTWLSPRFWCLDDESLWVRHETPKSKGPTFHVVLQGLFKTICGWKFQASSWTSLVSMIPPGCSSTEVCKICCRVEVDSSLIK